MNKSTSHKNIHPAAHTVIAELPATAKVSEQGIVQFILSRGLAKLKDAQLIARDVRAQLVAA